MAMQIQIFDDSLLAPLARKLFEDTMRVLTDLGHDASIYSGVTAQFDGAVRPVLATTSGLEAMEETKP